jgi:hypothetical protein
MSSEDFLPKGDRQLVTWGTRFVNVATANSTVVGIQSATLATYTTINTEFNNSILLVETKKAELKAAVKAKNDKRKQVTAQARGFNRFVQGRAEATDSVKLQLGLKVRPAHPEPVIPHTPELFTATGDSSGSNFLTWKHGKNKSGTLYEIWYCEGEGGKWQVLATSTKLRYTHQGVTPGVQTAYKIRAQRSDRFSEFSATSIVYMSGTAPVLTLSKAA